LRSWSARADNVPMGQAHTAQPTPSFVGRRVAWRGPAQRGFLPPEQRRAIADGSQRPPTPDEQLQLQPGDVGEVIELVTVTSAGHQYAIRFANGYEIETIIPSGLVTLVDNPPSPTARPARYAPNA
jgi:hypothetical protein